MEILGAFRRQLVKEIGVKPIVRLFSHSRLKLTPPLLSYEDIFNWIIAI